MEMTKDIQNCALFEKIRILNMIYFVFVLCRFTICLASGAIYKPLLKRFPVVLPTT